MVSVPYEITLLSNPRSARRQSLFVSVPYEITLLSNMAVTEQEETAVSVPYEITLLSNYILPQKKRNVFQYLMKLHYSQTASKKRTSETGFSTL